MKKILIAFQIIGILSMMLVPATVAEEEIYKINEAVYEKNILHGTIEAPAGNYFIRATQFFESGKQFIVLTCPVNGDNEFNLYVAAQCTNISLQLVDRIDAFVPGTYTVFATSITELK